MILSLQEVEAEAIVSTENKAGVVVLCIQFLHLAVEIDWGLLMRSITIHKRKEVNSRKTTTNTNSSNKRGYIPSKISSNMDVKLRHFYSL